MEVVQLREQNAKLMEERDSMVRTAVASLAGIPFDGSRIAVAENKALREGK